MALKYFVEAGAIAVRRVKKEDLRRIAKVRKYARNSARNSAVAILAAILAAIL